MTLSVFLAVLNCSLSLRLCVGVIFLPSLLALEC